MPDLDGEIVTLTHLPRSRWQTLLNLDVIQVNFSIFRSVFPTHSIISDNQQRNKPKEPPKAPEKAPFFLPTLPGVEARFIVQEKPNEKMPTRRSEKAAANAENVFVQRLSQEPKDSDCGCFIFSMQLETHVATSDEAFFSFAKSLSPAAADLEIRSLTTVQDLHLFLNALLQRLKSHRDFEAVQTYLNLFLRVHGEMLVSSPELRGDLEALLSSQRQESSRLLDSISSCLGTLAFVRDTI
jgi:U3 small nucleolar RNA-associated protein 21